jgi:threonine/homoserine efflux transporter RhtA
MTPATDVRPARDATLAGPAMMLGAALSNQFGAAAGTMAFGVIGPAGVTAVRQWIAGLVLLAAPGGARSPGRSGVWCCFSRRSTAP